MDIFKDLKVLELASVLAGPSVGQFFAELGADVIKVENDHLGGDITRSWKGKGEETDDRSAYFCSVNWGKKSIALDLNSDKGRSIVYDLIKKTDVLIASYKPGDAVKLGVDCTTLSAINPSLIYAQITGYGSESDRLGYDAVIQAEAGFMYMNGEPGGPSLKMPVALIDILAGHHLKEAILISLLHRYKTGKGDFVEVSLIDAAVASLANQATNWLIAGKLPQKQGSAHPNIAPYGDVFKTKDGKEILLAVGSDRQFFDLCELLTLTTLKDDDRFKTNASRVNNRQELNVLLAQQIEHWEADTLMHKINQKKIPAGIIQNMQQVFETKESKSVLLHDDIPGVRTYVAKSKQNPLIDFISPPPHLGQHSKEIINGL